MERLPTELVEQILVFLQSSTTDLTKFSKCNKRLSRIVNEFNHLWNRKIVIEYRIDNLKNCKKLKIQKGLALYKRLFKEQCITCHNKTTLAHPFFSFKMCNNCLLGNNEMSIISYTRVNKEYGMSKFNTRHLRTASKSFRFSDKTVNTSVFLLKEVKALYEYMYNGGCDCSLKY